MKWKKIAASTGIAFAALSSVFAAPAMANYDHNNRFDNDWRHRLYDNNRIVCVWVKDHDNNWRGDWRNNDKKLVCFVYDDGRFYALDNDRWGNNHHWNWKH